MSATQHQRPRFVGARTWLACFVIATVLGIGVALQRWSAYHGPNKPAFWNAEVIQPQLIPWYAWAAIAPLIMIALDRLPWGELRAWRRAALYVVLAILAISLHAAITGLALGWWWSFPSPIPVAPAWHIADQLRNRTTLSLLVVWLIAATYHARARASALPAAQQLQLPPVPPVPAVPAVPAVPTSQPSAVRNGPLALRAADRVWFVDPADIDWIEADGDYVIVHAATAHHRIRETVSSIERRVPSELLVRVSRSAIVNLSAVREMQRWFRGNFVIILRDGTRLTTGARYRDRIVRRI